MIDVVPSIETEIVTGIDTKTRRDSEMIDVEIIEEIAKNVQGLFFN